MARKQTAINTEDLNEEATAPNVDVLSTAPDDWEFETIIEESPTGIVFDTVGDCFIGQYLDRVTIEPENGKDPFDLFRFRGFDGGLYAVNPSGKLDKGMSTVKEGDWVRITLIKFIPSNKGNDFKDFRVEIKKN
jgi:hypothetical protein